MRWHDGSVRKADEARIDRRVHLLDDLGDKRRVLILRLEVERVPQGYDAMMP
jgi:hypothetical protein